MDTQTIEKFDILELYIPSEGIFDRELQALIAFQQVQEMSMLLQLF